MVLEYGIPVGTEEEQLAAKRNTATETRGQHYRRASYHFFSTILSCRVPVWAAMSFFRSPMLSSELKHGG